jgi:manganese-dependent inorganic pyrophosphatase
MESTSKERVYVIGHRNPDTDAICSAIGYAAFLRDVRGMDAEAACCGEVSVRTNWVLQQAGVPAPRLILDVRPTAATICRKEVLTACPDEMFLSVYRKMVARQFRSIPVVDDQGRLIGLPALQDMAQLFLPPDTEDPDSRRDAINREIRTSLANVAAAVGGDLTGASCDASVVEDLVLVVAASSVETSRRRAGQFPARQVALVTGDRPEIHALAIEMGVRCLVVTGGFRPWDSILAQAQERGVAVICSPYDTASTAQLMRFSRPVGEALTGDFVAFSSRTPLREVMAGVQNSHQALFAVVDEETSRLVGVFSKSDLIEVPRARLVLVDHNEFAQAVTGADEAEILEVIDHHRLSGNLRTREPIRFINEPVGSTSTIVGIMFRMRGAAPDRGTAVCLCAGIISDTLHLTSPTTTRTDREILDWLSGIAGVDCGAFVRDFFAAGSMLREQSAERALESDRKVFEENGWHISISQIEELGLEELWKRETELRRALETLREKHSLHFACLMVTDITRHHSVLLTAGDDRITARVDADYAAVRPGIFDLPGVVSRKKQLFPYMSHVVTKLSPPAG